MNMANILEKMKAQLRPKPELPEVQVMIKKVNSLLSKAKLEAKCTPGGSYAKGTILKDDFDIDLFVRFASKYKEKDISELLGRAISGLKPQKLHGSRDYYQVQEGEILFEIIPVLEIADYRQAANVTDMSPLHVTYVTDKARQIKGLGDEVRLAKQFAKAAKVYGAESYIRGFSGHMMDLLIIHYGSFEQLVMQASVWGERVIIDTEGHLKDPVKQLNKAKTSSPIILVDPIQPDRNAAAAISEEKFSAFKEAARRFIEKPSLESFKINPLDIKAFKNKWKVQETIAIKARPIEGKDDVSGAKALKAYEYLTREASERGFEVLDSDWEFGDEIIMCFAIKKGRLGEEQELIGPPLSQKDNSEKFKKAHKKTYERSGRLYAVEKRKYTEPRKLFQDLASSKFVAERIKQISFC